MTPFKVQLLNVLEELEDMQLKKFQWHLNLKMLDGFSPIPKSRLENATRTDTVDVMVESYKPYGALVITEEILRDMHRRDLVDQLPTCISDESMAPIQDTLQSTLLTPAQPLQVDEFITEIEVSLDEAQELQLQSRGFHKIIVDLNKGAKGKYIFLWYKKGGNSPITRMQVSFNDETSEGLAKAGYIKIPKDLSTGAGGDFIYLWYYKGSTVYDIPILDLQVTVEVGDEAPLFSSGWERLACDLNRGSRGNWIHVWMKRASPTFICDVTATKSKVCSAELFHSGYNRVDEDLNRGAEGAWVFLWYRHTTSTSGAVTHLDVSTNNEEYHRLQQQHFTPVNVNLNAGTKGDQVYLWYKKDHGLPPVRVLSVLVNNDARDPFIRAGNTVIEKNLNSGNDGDKELLAYYQ